MSFEAHGLRRRHLLSAALLAACPLQPASADWNAAAFDTHTAADALQHLGIAMPTAAAAGALQLDVPGWVDDGAVVEVAVASARDDIRRLLLIDERNPNALLAVFELTPAVAARVTTRVKLAETSALMAVAETRDGRAFAVSREIGVTQGGCGEGSGEPPPPAAPPQATRIRARMLPNGQPGAELRLLMHHEMETGQRKDADGRTIPAWHIAELAIDLDTRPVLTAQWGPAVSKNPYLQFRLPAARAGQHVRVAWRDNRGEQRSDEAVIV